MTTCGKCGATVADDAALFCGICGAPLSQPQAPKAEPVDRDTIETGGPPPTMEAPLPPRAGSPEARVKGTIPAAPISAALKPFDASAYPGLTPAVPNADVAAQMGAKGIPLAPPAGSEKPFKPPKHLPAGALVDKKYAVLRVLGEGGMGVVYLARDIHTGLDVVVKAVRSELAHRADVRARTLAEGRALAQIDHPNVVHLKAVVVEGPSLYLVMQYIDGESLDKIIGHQKARGERMPVEEALAIFRQVAAGVGAAHQEGVVHRDLKPANVIVRRKDRVAKVTDFGIALVQSDNARPHTRGLVGSLWYMSPEQVTGRRDLDHRVDIYALGILLYQMLVGHVPFDAKSDYEIMRQHAEMPMPLVSATRSDVPPAVDELIQRACEKDRERRFQRCEEMIAAVDRILGIGPASTLPGMTGPATPLPEGVVPVGLAGAARTGVIGAAPPPASPTLGESGASEPIAGSTANEAPKRRRWPWVVALVALTGAGMGAAFAFGLVPGVRGIWKLPIPLSTASAAASTSAPRPSASTASSGTSKPSALTGLAGSWVGNGRELEAVLSGNDLEFRVKRPEQFAPQGYEPGEARFVLRTTSDASTFTVEDRIRPVPPVGKTYDPRSRGTCQEVWTSVGNEPLKARFDGTRLTVEFAKIEPGAQNFTSEGAKVTSCVGLRELRASKVVSVLVRQ
ncbi:Serine/threonine protein kinase PrkC, regulator of stationary phase [Minicystis rosea]|nr:Serine/threonine protein kinase PrkC, regulator of stationary phase [Minicystis rosea]